MEDLTLSVNSFLETHFDQSELINKIRLFFCKMHFEYDLFKIKCRQVEKCQKKVANKSNARVHR